MRECWCELIDSFEDVLPIDVSDDVSDSEVGSGSGVDGCDDVFCADEVDVEWGSVSRSLCDERWVA